MNGVVEYAHVQIRLPVLRVDDDEVARPVQDAAPLVVAQPPDRGGLGRDLLAVLVQLRLRVLGGGDLELVHFESAVPGEGNLLGRRIEHGEETVAVDGEIEGHPRVLEPSGGGVDGSVNHPCAGTLGQVVAVDALHIPVHQLAEGHPLTAVALGVDVGDVVGLDVHAQLLLKSAHSGGIK